MILLLSPAILGLFLLTIYPTLYGLRISLIDYDLLSSTATGQWNWFQNYTSLFKSKEFWNAVRITFQYLLMAVSAEMVVGFGLALLLANEIRGISLARTVIISAMVMTPVIVGTAWRLMYNPGWGLISYFLSQFGVKEQAFLAKAGTVLPALVLVDVWEWSPFVMLILLAALQSVPLELYESAVVDGASAFQKFRYITLPMIKPAFAVALLIRTMDCFRTFDTIFAMTGGGPGTSSQNLNVMSYYTGLEFFHISSASAIAVVSLVMITVISSWILKVFGVSLWRSRQ
jgi:multiple sugar transport system permease protein